MEEQELTFNRFESYQFEGQYEWVALHNEEDYFPNHPKDQPAIKLCSQTLRIRANDAWSQLPKEDKECMVAHELGHRAYEHYLKQNGGLFGRYLDLLTGKYPQDEVEADSYAAKLVGYKKYLKLLEKMRDQTPVNENYSLQLLDYNLRIKALKERYYD